MDATVLLLVCVDCLMAIANGEFPENEARASQVINGLDRWADEGYHLAAGDNDGGFSWRGCDCCGSSLGGDRHEAVALAR